MSKFNTKNIQTIKTKSYEGGDVYKKNPLQDWFNFISSSMMADGFYETASEQQERYIELTHDIVDTYGAELAAKAAVFARNELGMRSITQLTAAILNNEKFNDKRSFFRNICHRPDDVAEIFAAIDMLDEKHSHALIRGCGDYLSKLNSYTLGKYKMKGHTYNMYDLINLTHAHSSVIDEYKNGASMVADTWETRISNSTSEEEKAENWSELLVEKKLGYLALIRNLNNIMEHTDVNMLHILCEQIVNADAIKKSLVFPYQIYVAYKNLKHQNPSVISALDRAFQLSTCNMLVLEGKNCMVLDVSGSMEDRFGSTCLTIKETAAVYMIALFLANPDNTDMIKFGNHAKRVTDICSWDSAFRSIEMLCHNDGCGYGTDISTAFEKMREEYDRIFIFSDMQVMAHSSWINYGETGVKSFKEYAQAYNNQCHCYSFDLSNYATQINDPIDKRVHLLTSLTDKTFAMIPWLEDEGSLLEYISNLSYIN